MLLYLARSFFPECYLPDDYLLPFEFARIPFSKFGCMSLRAPEDTTRMLIAGFIIVRVLIITMLLNVNEVFKRTLDITEHALVNVRLIGCILLCSFELTYSCLEDDRYVAMREKVKLGRRVFPRKDIPASCEVPVIPECPEAAELPFLKDDSEGLAKIQEFMERIVDNLYEPAKDMRMRALALGGLYSASSRRDLLSEKSRY